MIGRSIICVPITTFIDMQTRTPLSIIKQGQAGSSESAYVEDGLEPKEEDVDNLVKVVNHMQRNFSRRTREVQQCRQELNDTRDQINRQQL